MEINEEKMDQPTPKKTGQPTNVDGKGKKTNKVTPKKEGKIIMYPPEHHLSKNNLQSMCISR